VIEGLATFYRAVTEALQPTKTLKILQLFCSSPNMSHDEVKLLTSAVKKNYGLERLCILDSGGELYSLDDSDLHAILRLNRMGRGYLAVNGSTIVKGVDVLSAVSDDVNCVFLHLLENPSLCSRDTS
jgi:hypothetical protein